jgi:predicted TIM-barrel fold metal-dependent hydrolase
MRQSRQLTAVLVPSAGEHSRTQPQYGSHKGRPQGADEATMANRIDVHSHFLPPDYLTALRNAGIRDVDGYPLPQWPADLSLAAMHQNGIGAAVLSVSSPALGFVDGGAASELARSANESPRALITAHPDRFGAFALPPLPDVDASLREIAHSLDTLGLLTNYAGAHLGDQRFAPLFDELQRRKAVVFIHPTQPPGFARFAIALAAGFGDLSYFHRVFRRRFGATPADMRTVQREN